MVGDPEAVRRAARDARELARQLHADATSAAGLADVHWVSHEADRWRTELETTVAGLRADARAVEEVADALLAHAEACDRTLAQIAAARTAFDATVEHARRTLGRTAEEVGQAALDQARRVVDRAARAPARWSLDWLGF